MSSVESRIAAIGHLKRGVSVEQVAIMFDVSRQSVYRWWRDYQAAGYEGLQPRERTGRPPRIPARCHKEIRDLYASLPDEARSQSVFAEAVHAKFGVKMDASAMGRLMRRLGIGTRRNQRQKEKA